MDDARFMIDSWGDDEIEEYYFNIADTLRDPNRKGYVANAMWNVFKGAGNTYGLDDKKNADSNFDEFLDDVDNYLMLMD